MTLTEFLFSKILTDFDYVTSCDLIRCSGLCTVIQTNLCTVIQTNL